MEIQYNSKPKIPPINPVQEFTQGDIIHSEYYGFFKFANHEGD